MDNKLIIAPKTKVLQLLEVYPELEDILIRYVPAFKKLKNPLLRKTVAKIATLQQAAAIGNVEVGELINTLRKEVGQEELSSEGGIAYNRIKPDWFDEKLIEGELDIRDMLSSGEQPVNQVVSDLNQLSPQRVYKVIAPFLPAPLVDKGSSLGLSHWVLEEDNGVHVIYFFKE